MRLSINELIEYNNGDILRILWIDNTKTYVYVIKVNGKNTMPRQLTYEDIICDLSEDSSKRKEDDIYFQYKKENELTESEREGRDKAWSIIKDMVDLKNYPYIFDSNYRGKMIRKIMKNKCVTKPTIYNYLRKYWIGGQHRNSLIPKYANSGCFGHEKNLKEKKVGRPRQYNDIRGEGINITKDIKRIFEEIMREYYLTKNEPTLKETYIEMLKRYFSIETIDSTGKKILNLKRYTKIPTYEQFWYWYKKNKNLEEHIKSRKGIKEYEMNHRPILGNSMSDTNGPGSLYQIDATIADIYLVSRYDRSIIVGRPTVYFVIDTYSRMFTGVYVGYESPSWIGAMMALANSACDKVKFCKEYNIDIEKKDWDIEGIPEAILGDRGEIEGKSIESLIDSFGVDIKNTPPYRPDWKGIVENRFNMIPKKYKSITPGTVKKDFKKRGGKDYRLDATLDIEQFTQIIIKCILKYNNSCISGYQMDYKAIEDQVHPVPKEIWEWGIQNKTGILRYFSEELIKLNLMPVGNARVTRLGIKFKNILYTCVLAESEGWFDTAGDEGTWRIEVAYDPRNMSHIYIKYKNGRDFEVCTIIDCNKEYINKTLEEIRDLRRAQKRSGYEFEEASLNNEINLRADIENIISEAKEQTKKQVDKSKSKSARLKNIKQNKKEEKELERKEDAFVLSTEKELLENKNDKYEVVDIDTDEHNEDDFRTSEIKMLSSLWEECNDDKL